MIIICYSYTIRTDHKKITKTKCWFYFCIKSNDPDFVFFFVIFMFVILCSAKKNKKMKGNKSNKSKLIEYIYICTMVNIIVCIIAITVKSIHLTYGFYFPNSIYFSFQY